MLMPRTFRATFVTLLAITSAAEIVRLVDHDDDDDTPRIPARRPSGLRRLAGKLLARELAAWLETTQRDHSSFVRRAGEYLDFTFRTRTHGGAGESTAGHFLIRSPRRETYAFVGSVLRAAPRRTAAEYQEELSAILDDFAALEDALAEEAAESAALDAGLAAIAAGNLSAARAGYLGVLQAQFPEAGFT